MERARILDVSRAIAPVECMGCQGFSPADYDLYVLGLLGPSEAFTIDKHVESQCPECLASVKRSIRLWDVFTSSLGAAEPSSHFKQRLQEIMELSQSVLTFPKQEVLETRQNLPKWVQISIAATLAAMLTLCGWYAGHTSGSIDHQHLVTRVAQSEEELSSSRLLVQQQQQQTDRVNAALTASGRSDGVNQIASLQDRILRLEAEVTQYKSLLARSQQAGDEEKDLLLLLSSPNAKLVPMAAAQASPGSVGYALIIPNSKLVFVAANLTDLPNGREYQLWMMRGSPPKPVSGGVFFPDDSGHAYVQLDDGELVSDPQSLAVTDEPAGGSGEPTGSKIMSSGN